jgi:hypothetical protein
MRIAAPALLLALVTGCAASHPRTVPPVEAEAPSLPPVRMAAELSPLPPEFPATTERAVKLDLPAPAKEEAEVVEAPHPTHRRVKPAAQDTTPQDVPKTTVAVPTPTPAQSAAVAAAQPSEDSPIGQLSTANDTSNTGDRHAINEQIDSTENGVNGIKRTLSSEEQKTVAQIRVYVSKARDALKADDLDAARTLSNKAHQLLDQLTKE